VSYQIQTMSNKIKNGFLLACFFIGQLPTLFFGTTQRVNLSVFVERSTRIDFATMYYGNAISFIILTYLISYPKGVDKRIAKFVLIVCYLDFLHLFLFASKGFGMSKIAIGILVYYIYEIIKRKWRE